MKTLQNNNELNKYSLDFEKAYPYFIDRIKWKSLSLGILNKVNFKEGSFFTLLPLNARVDRLYHFKGGIHPPNPRIDNFEPITTLNHELSVFIHKFLSLNNLRFAVIENIYGKKGDTELEIEELTTQYVKEEVYYIIPPNASTNSIWRAIENGEEVWHFLAILLDGIKIDSFDESRYEEICSHIRYIITTAYDGEGYIFWEKNKTAHMDLNSQKWSDALIRGRAIASAIAEKRKEADGRLQAIESVCADPNKVNKLTKYYLEFG